MRTSKTDAFAIQIGFIAFLAVIILGPSCLSGCAPDPSSELGFWDNPFVKGFLPIFGVFLVIALVLLGLIVWGSKKSKKDDNSPFG